LAWDEYNSNERYLKRITSQHKIKPLYMAMVKAYLDILQDTYTLIAAIDNKFNLDTAIGVQLDAIGQIVGAKRKLDFEPDYANTLLSDEDYRAYIRAVITLNQWDGTTETLNELLANAISTYTFVLHDYQDMSVLAEFRGDGSIVEMEMLNHGLYAPNAQGVGVNYLFSVESEIEGQIYIFGITPGQSTRDTILELESTAEDTDVFGTVYVGAKVVSETIKQTLRGVN